jgi:proline racemase
MCGHGLIGVVRTLEFLGRLRSGAHRFDTPVGTVRADCAGGKVTRVTFRNVPAFAAHLGAPVEVPTLGTVAVDVAYGGNWFFITHTRAVPVDLAHVRELTRFTHAVQDAIRAAGITGAGGADIDHIEISAPPSRGDADARNYVLCSGGDYDRSPCGTGTSATMAALHARGRLALGQPWRQESITGSLFTGWLTSGAQGELIPHVRGTAFVTGETTLHFDPRDPFQCGFGSA